MTHHGAGGNRPPAPVLTTEGSPTVMHTDTDTQRAAEERGREIARQIAELLNEAEALAPGGTSVSPGRVRVIGSEVVRRMTAWEAQG
ncbi:hypothetical protein [Streptomyces cinereoruber]|uniref:hypothetical protein n=1 Tax=Streptomyces cinereoruber TaxID=67260 RepID=UPI00363CECC1